MSLLRRPLRLSVQTKALSAVLLPLILLPTVTVWVVNRHITQQVLADAERTLTSAEAVFLESLEFRSRNLQFRFRNVVNEPRFKAVAIKGDAKTMVAFLAELLEEFGEESEVILFIDGEENRLASAQREPTLSIDGFERAASTLTRIALAGDLGKGSVSLGGRAYNVVSVPVTSRETGPVVGALTIGIRIGDTAVRDFKALTQAEIVIATDDLPAASTLPPGESTREVLKQMVEPARSSRRLVEASLTRSIEAENEHFLALSGNYDRVSPQRGFRYLLLSSYEQRLEDLSQTRRTLVGLGVLGILLSGLIVSLAIRRLIRPLRELRDSTEAVGRGDFSKRVETYANDEIGELAQAFNHMTANLQSSREELEKTVTTLKTTQSQLVQSEKLSAVGQFVAGVAHDLNNPLTAVIGFSELLVLDEKDEKARQQLTLIAKSAHRCHKIVQSLLGFARQHTPERRRVELHAVVDEVLEIMAYDMRTSNIKVHKEYAPTLPSIMADSHQLQQVFVNILANARQAMQAVQREGEITVRTHGSREVAIVEFKDNGPGISPANLAKIFDPFFTTKPVGQGTGLGLSLTYGIVQEHGGKIGVHSELGHGATFRIEFPAAKDTPRRSIDAEQGADRAESSLAGHNVLVVDDEPWILALIRELLEREGCLVETVTDGEKAVEILRNEKFEIIVSDWKMPGMSGVKLYEHLLAHDPASAKRMLFMTGDVVNSTLQTFLRENGRSCVPKPFSTGEFRSAVAAMLKTNG